MHAIKEWIITVLCSSTKKSKPPHEKTFSKSVIKVLCIFCIFGE